MDNQQAAREALCKWCGGNADGITTPEAVGCLCHKCSRVQQPSADGFDYMRVREWMLSSPRKPANQAFTAEAERNAAYLIEEYDAAKPSVTVEELIKYLCCNTNLFTNDIEEAAQAILAKYNVTVKG